MCWKWQKCAVVKRWGKRSSSITCRRIKFLGKKVNLLICFSSKFAKKTNIYSYKKLYIMEKLKQVSHMHLLESGRTKVARNFIYIFKLFLLTILVDYKNDLERGTHRDLGLNLHQVTRKFYTQKTVNLFQL